MSSILKALKKLEKDTAQSKPEQLRIDARILSDGVSGTLSRTKIVLIAISIFMCGGGATYYYMSHSPNSLIPQQSIHSNSESLTQTATSSVISPSFKKNTIRTTTPDISAPKPSTNVNKRTRLLNESLISSERPQPENQHPELTPAPESKPVTVTSTSTSATFRPALTVNGIAFQDGGNDNLAMINGNAVTKGTMIEGVMVEDIQKDRVLFSQGAEKFEIRLNKSNR